jgi:hypothetical protein
VMGLLAHLNRDESATDGRWTGAEVAKQAAKRKGVEGEGSVRARAKVKVQVATLG